jgi:CHAD domain-containing protein
MTIGTRERTLPALAPGMTAAAALDAIVRAGGRDFRVARAALTATGDDEALHEAHVALRRLRTALALFDDAVGDRHRTAWDRLRSDLRDLAHAFGDARQLDVLLATYGDAPAVAARFTPERAAARAVCLAAGASCAPLLRRLSEQARTADALRQSHAHTDADVFFAARLDRWRGWLRRHGHGLAALTPPARHRVRLRVKRLRYAIEFAAPLFAGDRAAQRLTRQVRALTALQRHLGDLNDMAEAAALLGRPALLDPVRSAGLLDHAQRHFARFDAAKPFWR